MFFAASVWLFLRLSPLRDTLVCVVDGYTELRDFSTERNLTAASEVFDAIDSTTIDSVNEGLDNLKRGVSAPGFCTAGIMLLAALTSICCWPSLCCRLVSKVLVLLGNLLLLLSLVVFGALLGAAIVAGMAQAREFWDDEVGGVCRLMSLEISGQLNVTKASLQEATLNGVTSAQLAPYRSDVREAELQLEAFVDVCDCIDSTPESLRPLLGPGALGVASFFLGFVALNGLCCAMGCCRDPQAAAAAKRQAMQGAISV